MGWDRYREYLINNRERRLLFVFFLSFFLYIKNLDDLFHWYTYIHRQIHRQIFIDIYIYISLSLSPLQQQHIPHPSLYSTRRASGDQKHRQIVQAKGKSIMEKKGVQFHQFYYSLGSEGCKPRLSLFLHASIIPPPPSMHKQIPYHTVLYTYIVNCTLYIRLQSGVHACTCMHCMFAPYRAPASPSFLIFFHAKAPPPPVCMYVCADRYGME